eukprot:g32342.t1
MHMKRGELREQYRVVVVMTTIPQRIQYTEPVIDSMLRQTWPANDAGTKSRARRGLSTRLLRRAGLRELTEMHLGPESLTLWPENRPRNVSDDCNQCLVAQRSGLWAFRRRVVLALSGLPSAQGLPEQVSPEWQSLLASLRRLSAMPDLVYLCTDGWEAEGKFVHRRGCGIRAMMKIPVQLVSGEVALVEASPETTISELKEQLKALQPTKDELTRKMTHVELICEGHLLQDNNVTVTGAKISSTSEVQALYRINVLECSCREEADCELEDLLVVSIPSSATQVVPRAFDSCGDLLRVTIPEPVASIGDYAFEDCISLADLTMPESLEKLGNFCFKGCSSLATLTIPRSVQRIGKSQRTSHPSGRRVRPSHAVRRSPRLWEGDANTVLVMGSSNDFANDPEELWAAAECAADMYDLNSRDLQSDELDTEKTGVVGSSFQWLCLNH